MGMATFAGKKKKSSADVRAEEGDLPSLRKEHDTPPGQKPATNGSHSAIDILAFLVAFASFLVYIPSLRNEFVWDDVDYVTGNPHIRSLGSSFFRWAFLDFHASNWHPLTWFSHALDYAVWGLHPLGHHLVNNILHAVNSFLVVVVASRLIEADYDFQLESHDSRFPLIAAVVTGLLFGIHPIHVESVAWVAERKDLLCAIFYLLSIMTYLKLAAGDAPIGTGTAPPFFRKYYLLTFVFFILALLSKPMAVSLPVVLLILDWYPLRKIFSLKTLRNACLEKLPFIGLSLISAFLTIQAQKAGGAMALMEVLPVSIRLPVAAKSLVAYLGKMIVPAHLIPYYPYPEHVAILSSGYVLPVLLLLGITALSAAVASRRRLLLAVWSYYLVTLLPVIGIIQVGEQSMADRYAYLPGLGPTLLAGLLAASIWTMTTRLRMRALAAKIVCIAAGAAILASLGWLTLRQTGIWKDSITLWTYVIAEEPERVPLAYNNRGLALSNSGQLDDAIRDFSAAIDLNPYNLRYYHNRGEAFGKKGEFDKALRDYDRAIALDPQDASVFLSRGLTYFSAGQDDHAADDFSTACSMGNDFGCTMLQALGEVGHP